MRIFFVNQYVRDANNSRGLPEAEHLAHPYFCTTYVTVAENPKAAIENVRRNHESLSPNWTDWKYQVQNEDGMVLHEPVAIGRRHDATLAEVDRIFPQQEDHLNYGDA